MYAKLAIALLAATSALAAGNGGYDGGNDNGSCNTGTTACCDQVQDPSSKNYADFITSLASQGLLKDIGVPVQGLGVPIGATCNPITVVAGQLGQNCQSTTTCCDRVTNNGVGVNCSPVNINL